MRCALKTIYLLGIILLCCLALVLAMLHRFQTHTPEIIYIVPKIEHKIGVKRNEKPYAHLKPKPIDHEERFFQTIIDNNIFAPLGWKPKKPTPVYRLIGTHIPVGSKIEAIAILQETTDAAIVRVVSIGTKLGELYTPP